MSRRRRGTDDIAVEVLWRQVREAVVRSPLGRASGIGTSANPQVVLANILRTIAIVLGDEVEIDARADDDETVERVRKYSGIAWIVDIGEAPAGLIRPELGDGR